MLLHLCDVVLDENDGSTDEQFQSRAETGCSSILCNQKDVNLNY